MEEGRVVRGTSSTCPFRIVGESYPLPPPALQSTSRSHKHQHAHSAMQEQPGELQEQGKQTLILGTTHSSLPSATPRQGPNLGAAPRPTESGDWAQGDNTKRWVPRALQGRVPGAPTQPALSREERRPCTFGRPWAGRGGLELNQPTTGHHRYPRRPSKGSPGHPKLSGA